MSQRTRFQTISLQTPASDLSKELRQGLSSPQKTLPAKLFYDEKGSQIFEQICGLPEYYLTRTENRILRQNAGSIIELCPPSLTLVELGSGSSSKTRQLIDACLQKQAALIYYPIDVSETAQQMAADGLLPLFGSLQIIGLTAEFEVGLEYLEQHPDEPHLVLFLGSTIGNFDEEELHDFLQMLRKHLRPIDRFLLGFDLLKDPSILIPAYDDAQGVTANFNCNILLRLNREFGADFDLAAFDHQALFNPKLSRIEMHLVSARPQNVRIPGLELDVSFARGETIHTENSYKHSRDRMSAILKIHGFHIVDEFMDEKQFFCLTLVR